MTSKFAAEHVVVESELGYDAVIAALEIRLGDFRDLRGLLSKLGAGPVTPEGIAKAIDQAAGPSGLGLFHKADHGELLTLTGTPRRVCQYAIGNPTLACKMVVHVPDVALYAPLRLAVYENSAGHATIVYDHFTSLVAQFQNSEALAVANIVQQKLEALVAEVAEGNTATATR